MPVLSLGPSFLHSTRVLPRRMGAVWGTGKYMSKRGIPNHGWSKTRFYALWESMWDRCRRRENYKGMSIQPSWRLFTSFLADMFDSYSAHEKEHGRVNTTLDRLDNSKGYSKANCRWATRSQQNSNKKGTKYYTAHGITDTLIGWTRRLGIGHSALQKRLKTLPLELALTPGRKKPWSMRPPASQFSPPTSK